MVKTRGKNFVSKPRQNDEKNVEIIDVYSAISIYLIVLERLFLLERKEFSNVLIVKVSETFVLNFLSFSFVRTFQSNKFNKKIIGVLTALRRY